LPPRGKGEKIILLIKRERFIRMVYAEGRGEDKLPTASFDAGAERVKGHIGLEKKKGSNASW